MNVRAATPDEAPLLTALALRSKAHWGYDAAFMAACADELTLRPGDVVASRTLVAEEGGRLVGFITVVGAPPTGEVGALFVEPDAMGAGIGARLVRTALTAARAEGFDTLTVDADPDAEPFYLRVGALRMGSTPSGSIPGRVLPHLRFDLR